mgnify:CR=1 FL=1
MVYCHQHPISPPRVFVFHKKPLCLWKTVQILFTFSCRYAVCIPVFAHKLPLFTQSLPEFPAIRSEEHTSELQLFHALLIRSSFLFFMIESIGGPYYRPQLEELLCTKPNSRATPKRRPALYMP